MAQAEAMQTMGAVSPVFAEVCAQIFGGGIDPRELVEVSKKSGEGLRAASSVLSARQQKEKSERTQARVGLASNAVGLAAGTAGTAAALRDDRFKGLKPNGKVDPKSPKILRSLHSAASKLPAPISSKTGKAGALLAAGALGLQVGNIGGDLVANRVLARAAKSKEVKKDFDEGLAAIRAARAAGVIDAQTAVEMGVNLASEAVAKALPIGTPGSVRAVHYVATTGVATPWSTKVANAKRGTKRLNPVVRRRQNKAVHDQAILERPQGQKALLGMSVAGAGGAGVIGGVAHGKRKGRAEMAGATFGKAQVDYGFTGEISKTDDDKQLAFGWCSLSTVDGEPVVDLQGDYIPIEEIEKSAYAYVKDSRKGGDMHARDGDGPRHTADIVESMVVTPEKLAHMGISADIAKSVPTGWWIGMAVHDEEQWRMVKSGERTGFSVHGTGRRMSKALDS